MKTLRTRRILALFGILALAACDESTPIDAFADENLTLNQTMELELLAEADPVEVALDLATFNNDLASDVGHIRAFDGRSLNAEGRTLFANAQDALRAGDREAALRHAAEARRRLAEALVATGGEEVILSLIEWLEKLIDEAAEDPDMFDDPEAAIAELNRIATAAREAWEAGETVEAGALAILGLQRVRFRLRHHDRPDDRLRDRARLRVALAGSAVRLAQRLLWSVSVDVEPDLTTDLRGDVAVDVASLHDVQNRHLQLAKKQLAMAERALAAGRFARAVHFAELATWSALKAVVLPGGVNEADARRILWVAETLFERACPPVISDAASDLLRDRLCARSGRLLQKGKMMLEEGKIRGIGTLWQSAVISHWLIVTAPAVDPVT